MRNRPLPYSARSWFDEPAQFRVFSVDGPEELLSAFIGIWERDRHFGYRLELCRGEFPPLTARQAEAIQSLAHDWYWRNRLCGGTPERNKECLRAIAGAAEAAVAAYRASKGGASRGERLRRLLRERDGDDCWVCGHELGEDCTIEHKRALANGGTWAFQNLALAHRECNRALGRLPAEAKEAVRATRSVIPIRKMRKEGE